jgi:formiminotetrahydrofolate cyclodeaminase
MLMDMTVRDFLQELASDSPAPGGGSVAALSGALSAALVMMVARLTLGMKGVTEEKTEKMNEVITEAIKLFDRLSNRVDADTEAFNKVMAAYKMPKGTAEEKEDRSEAIQNALKGAARHPMEVAEECTKLQTLCADLVTYGNQQALSDTGVASLLAHSGMTGALYNVAINLEGIKDTDFGYYTAIKCDQTMTEAGRREADVRSLLNNRLNYKVYW